jgi:hypothetical protein
VKTKRMAYNKQQKFNMVNRQKDKRVLKRLG